MRRFWLVAIVCMSCLVSERVWAGDNPWERKLPFAGATLHYTLSGSQEGTEDKYIRDYGREMATYRKATTVMMGMKMVTDTVEIQDADWMYSYDLKENTGTKMTNPQKFMIEEYNKLTPAEKKQVQKNAEAMGTSFMKGMNGKMEQNVTKILGRDCDRTSVMGSTVYMLHGTPIPLKTEMDMAGMKMASVATSFLEGAPESRYFEHPAGIEAIHTSESDEMSRSMAVQMMAMLKDPDGVKKMNQQQPSASGSGGDPQGDQEMMKQAEQMMKDVLGK